MTPPRTTFSHEVIKTSTFSFLPVPSIWISYYFNFIHIDIIRLNIIIGWLARPKLWWWNNVCGVPGDRWINTRALGHFSHIWSPINRSIWTCRRSNDLWQDAMKWWTFGDMKNGLGIYTNVTGNWNGSGTGPVARSHHRANRTRSTAITSRGGRLVPERPDAVEQVWTRAPGCVPEPFRSQSCGVNTALVRRQSRSSCWVKQRGRLVCPAGGGWWSQLWLPQDCLEIVCCLVTE